MGKKTNWTTAEDQTLCRVWQNASDLQLHVGEQKTANFWNVVREMFHQEMETAVERPLTGLKVRWTRINRDSQKFAGIFNEIQGKNMKQTEESIDDSGDAAAVALLAEQQWIDEAKDIFHRIYHAKFSFEACWKQLRYCNKWLQLFTNSSSNTVLIMNVTPTSTVVTEESHTSHQAPSSTSSEQEITTTDNGATTTRTAAPSPAASPASPSHSHETTTTSVTAAAAVAAVSQTSTEMNAFAHKRRADVSLEAFTHSTNQQQPQELQGLTATLVEELKRQNDLMEDQNAIALLKVDGEMITDAEARHCYQLLKARYLKKARISMGRTSTLV